MPRNKTAADVDQQDDDAGDRIAPHEPAGTVHRAEEIRLAINLFAAAVGFVLVDQAGVQVGVDRHLTAGEPVESEPRGHLADPGRPLSDHHELDHDQDREQDHTHDHLIAGHEFAEGADHAAGRVPGGPHRLAVSTSRVVATFNTSRMSVVVKRMVGNALNSCGVRIARVVKSTTTATVKLTDNKTSSSPGGIGTTKTRIAPMIVTGRTNPRRKPPPDSDPDSLDVVGGIRSPQQTNGGGTAARPAGKVGCSVSTDPWRASVPAMPPAHPDNPGHVWSGREGL